MRKSVRVWKRILSDCRPTRRDLVNFTNGAASVASATHILVNGPTPILIKLPNRRKNTPGFGRFVEHSAHVINGNAATKLEHIYAAQAKVAKEKAGRLLEISESKPYRIVGERDYVNG